MDGTRTPPSPTREQKKDEVRARITDAVMALIAEGANDLSHDAVATRAEVGRRTVYRYFPDRDALLQSVWVRVNELARSGARFPTSYQDLLDTIVPIYTGFDRIAPLATLIRATPQGRAVRRSQNKARVAAYTKVGEEVAGDLPPEDRMLVAAMLQVLHTTPWLEMRDHWSLTGEQIAKAAGWAIRTLVADVRARGDRPLDQD
jgi:AcrR family transcriptional regulator